MQETRDLSAHQCEALLRAGIAGIAGRVAISTPTGPYLVPVNYTVVDDAIVVRTSPYSLLGTHGRDTMIAFGIGGFDHEQERGWSVQARGRVEVVTAPPGARSHPRGRRPEPVGQWGPDPLPEVALDGTQRAAARRQLGPGPRRTGEHDLLTPGC